MNNLSIDELTILADDIVKNKDKRHYCSGNCNNCCWWIDEQCLLEIEIDK